MSDSISATEALNAFYALRVALPPHGVESRTLLAAGASWHEAWESWVRLFSEYVDECADKSSFSNEVLWNEQPTVFSTEFPSTAERSHAVAWIASGVVSLW